ncbi:type II toxin-antitoxin system HicB family antitoxin [Methanogenium sp. MK-MG]|uniref:type II toxin-antitoxin system HicB family antitoxin n=1 Tax=Methanogenium sp. MK-MG TaxID=2599926 RepID=UPI0013EAA76F|nr:type II toxin-antitoxin system HicB family antitoxin [Methanogenium sp. MK-MG]KAF1079020.1 hypothetical protein MKMG_00029 [Methanogenium sp. MK-MG]
MIQFRILLEKDEDGWFTATVPSLPGCISQGRTEEEAKKNIAEAIELHLKSPPEFPPATSFCSSSRINFPR